MTVYLDLPNLFNLFCIVQGLTTALVLFRRQENPANRWLAWLIAGLTLQVVDYFLSRSGVYYHHRWLYFMPLFFSWSFGPLLYAYVRTRAGHASPGHASPGQSSPELPGLYWLPVAVQALFYLLLMAQPLATKAWFWLTVHKPYTRYVEHYVAAGLVLWAIHRSWPLVAERRLRLLLAGLAVFYVVAAIDPLLNHLYLPPRWPKFYLTALLLPVFAYASALVGLFQERRKPVDKPGPSVTVTDEQRARVLLAIRQHELYKDPDLTLTALAQHLGETPNAVSRVINAGFGQTFNELINTYRIEEVKRRMASGDTDRLTLLGLALDAGFSSKTTFNRVFKEQTGYTPSAYAKKSQITFRDDTNA